MSGLVTEEEVQAFISAKHQEHNQQLEDKVATVNGSNTIPCIKNLLEGLNKADKISLFTIQDESTTNEPLELTRQDVFAHWYRNYSKSELTIEKKKVLQWLAMVDQEADWDKFVVLTSRCNAINIRLRVATIGEYASAPQAKP